MPKVDRSIVQRVLHTRRCRESNELACFNALRQKNY